jgi:hypothetical protein
MDARRRRRRRRRSIARVGLENNRGLAIVHGTTPAERMIDRRATNRDSADTAVPVGVLLAAISPPISHYPRP